MTADAAASADGTGSRFLRALTPEARAAFDAWLSLSTGGGPPPLLELAPHRLPRSLLPRLMLFESEPGGQWLCRLAGEEMWLILARNAKGRRLEELVRAAERERRHRQFQAILETGLPLWFSGPLQLDTRSHITIGRLALPLKGAGGVPLILVAYTYIDDPAAVRGRRAPESGFGPTEAIICAKEDLG